MSLSVNRGEHARPATNVNNTRSIGSLSPEQSTSQDFEMLATSELSHWDDIWNAEDFAHVSVSGKVDPDRLLHARTTAKIRIDF